MILDFRAADCPDDIQADICVIGAGAAGITIAHALAGTSLSVCVVESGGLDFDGDTQALYEGHSVGLPWGTDLEFSRLRFFGGSTGHWGGGCVPLDAADMEVRDWVPHSGWPIRRRDLDPYYDRARGVLGLPDYPFDDDRLLTALVKPPVVFDPALLKNIYYMASGNPRFGEFYRAELAASGNVTVLLNANLMEFAVNATAATVRQASVRNLQGRGGRVRARFFVLACGGIENARLLLLSNSVSKPGLGNDRDLVGRFFMDHPSGKLGSIFSNHAERLTGSYDRHLPDPKLPIFPNVVLARALQENQRILNGRLRPEDFEDHVPDGVAALRNLRGELADGRVHALPSEILRIVADLDDVLPSVVRVLRGRPAVLTHRIDFEGFFEQAPNPDSRVTLGDDTDALGQRRVDLDWRLTELDRRTYETAARVFPPSWRGLTLGGCSWSPGCDPRAPRSPVWGGSRITWVRPACPPIPPAAWWMPIAGFMASTTCMLPEVRCFRPAAGRFRPSRSSRWRCGCRIRCASFWARTGRIFYASVLAG